MQPANAKSRCVRCPAKSIDKDHHFSKCTERRGAIERVPVCWSIVDEVGAAGDKIGDYAQCEALLVHIESGQEPKRFRDKQVTKWMLENALDIVYNKKGAKKQPQQQTRPAPIAGPSNAVKGKQTTTTLASRPALGQVSQSGSTTNSAVLTPSTIIEQPAHGHGNTKPPRDDFLARLYEDCPTEELGGGAAERVITNYVRVKSLPKHVYMYSLSYGKISEDDQSKAGTAASDQQSEDVSRAQKRLILKSLGDEPPLKDRKDWATTDCDTIWSIKPLADETREPAMNEDYSTHQVYFHKLSGKSCTISNVVFKFVKKLGFYDDTTNKPDLGRFVDNLQPDQESASLHKTALNALISQHVASHSTTDATKAVIAAGPNKFFMRESVLDFNMLEAHRGYFTFVRPGSHNILLNVGFQTGAFYRPVKLSAFLQEITKPVYSEYGVDESTRRDRLLRGRIVKIIYSRTQHDPTYDPNHEANRRRVICSFGDSPHVQMFRYGDQEITVSSYFTDVLKLSPPNKALPCVNVGVKQKFLANGHEDPKTVGKQVWIPADYLMIEPGQQFGRRLAGVHMEDMIKATLRGPGQNLSLIVNEGLGAIMSQNPNGFPDLGIAMEKKLLSIPASFLVSPEVRYQNTSAPVHQASWNLLNTRFIEATPRPVPAGLRRTLGVLDFRMTPKGGNLRWIGGSMVTRMRYHGMDVDQSDSSRHYWSYREHNGGDSARPPQTLLDKNLVSVVEEALKKLSVDARVPELYLLVLEKQDVILYGTIKRIFDQVLGRHTVCLTADNFLNYDKQTKRSYPRQRKEMDQTFSNLALKFNVKLGGQNHAVSRPGDAKDQSAFSSIADDTMVVGADVSHAPSSMAHCPSVAAVVASDSASFAQFPGSMRLQASKQEFIEDLRDMMRERIQHYHRRTGRLPGRILFYRDGVGEDMYSRVRAEEVQQIKDAFADVSKAVNKGTIAKLELTFVIVGKRHNTRFFASGVAQVVKAADQRGKGNANIKPGLIVDKVITQPSNSADGTFDFFLLSHQAITGTARPAHYVVLQNGGLSPEEIKSLTYHFCFNFARATKGVSYVAPAYLADRLCERGTLYLKAYTTGRDTPDIEMTDQEKNGSKDDIKTYQRRVAQHISKQSIWNPGFSSGRTDPWHESMDDIMFWI